MQSNILSNIGRHYDSDVPAIITSSSSHSYRELIDSAASKANKFVSAGLKLNEPVVLFVDHTFETISTILGIWMAGGVYVPVDKSWPQERVDRIIAQFGKRFVIEDASNVLDFNDLTIDTNEELKKDSTFFSRRIGDTGVSYILFTSGSTGVPKGIVVSDNNLLSHAKSIQEIYKIKPSDRVLQFTSLTFDVSLEEIIPALSAGASLILRNTGLIQTPRELFDFMNRHRISVVNLPAAYFHQCAIELTSEDHLLFRHLRLIVTGNDKILMNDLRRWKSLVPHATLLSAYGLTETTITNMLYEFMPDDDYEYAPLGIPIPGVSTRIRIDAERSNLRSGKLVGELVLSGKQVSNGYFDDPLRTDEKFVNRFGEETGQFFYTGDIVEYDGTVMTYIGRSGDFIKLNGHRIEISEIEAHMHRFWPDHLSSVQVLSLAGSNDKKIHAFIQNDSSKSLGENEIRARLSEVMPSYMIPRFIHIIDDFPLTPGGKPDVRRLQGALAKPKISSLPNDSIERKILNIWEQVLKRQDINPDDDFFELGGHSLAAMQVLVRLNEVFNHKIKLKTIFDFPTASKLAGQINKERKRGIETKPEHNEVIVADRNENQRVPLTRAQQRVWFMQQINPSGRAYQFVAAHIIKGKLDIESLSEAFHFMINRHEAYRLSFHAEGSDLWQRINKSKEFRLPMLDVGTISEHDRQETIVQAIMNAEFEAPIDPCKAEPARFLLIRKSATESILLHAEHHLIHDGWSFNLFMRELFTCYLAFTSGKSPKLDPIPLTYTEYAEKENEFSEFDDNLLREYASCLSGIPEENTLAPDYPRELDNSNSGKAPVYVISTPLSERLREYGRLNKVTLFMTMFTVFDVLIYSRNRNSDMVIGTAIANRTDQRLELTVGMFVNNYVIRTKILDDDRFTELLKRNKISLIDNVEYQKIPFDQLVKYMKPVRKVNVNPIFQLMFSFHDSPLPRLAGTGVEFIPIESVHNGSSKFDIDVVVIPKAEQQLGSNGDNSEIIMQWEFNSKIYREETIEKLFTDYEKIVEIVLGSPEITVREIISRLNAGGESAAASSQMISPTDILRAFEKILGIQDLHVDSNFFHHGGSSLSALQLSQVISKSINYQVPLRVIFDSPTPSEMATSLSNIMKQRPDN